MDVDRVNTGDGRNRPHAQDMRDRRNIARCDGLSLNAPSGMSAFPTCTDLQDAE